MRVAALDGLPGGALNIAHECVDRHAEGSRRDDVAIRWLGTARRRRVDSPIANLRTLTNRFANVLDALGVERGERVFVLTGRIPELYVAVLGALKHGSVACTLFSAFGPEPIRQRLDASATDGARHDRALYRRKVAPDPRRASRARARAARRRRGATPRRARHPSTSPRCSPSSPTSYDDRADRPGRHGAAALHERHDGHAEGRGARARGGGRPPRDRRAARSTCTPTTFLVHGRPGLGHRHVVRDRRAARPRRDEHRRRGRVRRARWYQILEDAAGERLVHRADRDPDADEGRARATARDHDLPALRFIASVGEPLNPEAVRVGRSRRSGCPIHDNWWQTETGGIMIANFAAMRHPPGLDGPAAARRRGRDPAPRRARRTSSLRDGERRDRRRARWRRASSRCGPAGRRCSAATSHDDERYAKCFAGGWYLTGDLATRDADGYFWFVGPGRRRDQVGRPPDRPVRGRERADGAPGRRRGRRDRQARPGGRRGRQGVRACCGPGTSRRDALRLELIGFGRDAPRRRGRPEGDRVRRRPAEDAQRQDHAAAAPGPRARAARRRPVDAGGAAHDRRASTASTAVDLLPRDAAHPPVRGALRRAVQRDQDPRLPAPLHRRGGRRGRRDAGARRPTTPSSRPTASTGTRSRAACRPPSIMAEMFGKVEGCSRGRGGSMHLFDAARASTAATPSSAAGCRSRSASRSPTACRGGRASPRASSARARSPRASSTSRMNLAALWHLPVLFCCENNLYAMGTALDRSESETDLALKAASYEMPAWSVDGMDVLAVEAAAAPRRATAIRGGGGPHFLELRTYRFRAHSMYDPELYRDKAEVERWKQRDPLAAVRRAAARPGRARRRERRSDRGRGRRRDRRRGRVRRGRHARSRSRTSPASSYSRGAS